MKFLIIANWKMNPESLKKAEALFGLIKQEIKDFKNKEVVICPPFVYLEELIEEQGNFKFGGQDCAWQESGALTSEVSPVMLKNLGCEYVILGHSEKRINSKETNEMVNKKLKAALKAGLKPILCIGDNDLQGAKEQLRECLEGVKLDSNLSIVYEPIWAISTQNGQEASPDQARAGKELIESFLKQKEQQRRFFTGAASIAVMLKPIFKLALTAFWWGRLV